MRSQSSRDVLRQDAKLHEMTEEVRRREMRSSGVMSPHQYATQQRPPPNRVQPYLGYQDAKPTTPSSYVADQARPQHDIVRSQQYNQPMRASIPEPVPPVYRESPPPPPPPPTSTHPLYQTSPPRNEPNRYMASGGEPPRGGFYQTPAEQQSKQQYPYQGTNPWQREEKEKEAERRREAARMWRDQQMGELVALGPNRTVSQEEQLRALRLEKEFERRAQEEGEDDDDDDQVRSYTL